MTKRKNALRDTLGDKIFYAINGFFLLLLALIILYPLYFIIIASISDPDAVLGGEVVLYPVRITMEGFAKIMERRDIISQACPFPKARGRRNPREAFL